MNRQTFPRFQRRCGGIRMTDPREVPRLRGNRTRTTRFAHSGSDEIPSASTRKRTWERGRPRPPGLVAGRDAERSVFPGNGLEQGRNSGDVTVRSCDCPVRAGDPSNTATPRDSCYTVQPSVESHIGMPRSSRFIENHSRLGTSRLRGEWPRAAAKPALSDRIARSWTRTGTSFPCRVLRLPEAG
jgi:hypothetical protein